MNKKISTFILTLVLMFAMVIPVSAAGAVTGDVTASNVAPDITSVTLQATGGAGDSIISMTALTEYWVEIVAADINTIDDIKQIDVYIFYDGNGSQDGTGNGTFDCDQNAVFQWVKASGWSRVLGDVVTTTWAMGTTNASVTPSNMELTEGEWNLSFRPGKLAMEALASGSTSPEWDIYVKVSDTVTNAASTIYTKAMTAYSEISMTVPVTYTPNVSFGTVALNGNAVIQGTGNKVNTVVISNDTHELGVMSAATWIKTGGNHIHLDESNTPGANEFGLGIDDAATSGDPTTPQAVTTGDVTILNHDADARTATVAGANESTTNIDLFMKLKLGEEQIDIGKYSGTITFTVTNN